MRFNPVVITQEVYHFHYLPNQLIANETERLAIENKIPNICLSLHHNEAAHYSVTNPCMTLVKLIQDFRKSDNIFCPILMHSSDNDYKYKEAPCRRNELKANLFCYLGYKVP